MWWRIKVLSYSVLWEYFLILDNSSYIHCQVTVFHINLKVRTSHQIFKGPADMGLQKFSYSTNSEFLVKESAFSAFTRHILCTLYQFAVCLQVLQMLLSKVQLWIYTDSELKVAFWKKRYYRNSLNMCNLCSGEIRNWEHFTATSAIRIKHVIIISIS